MAKVTMRLPEEFMKISRLEKKRMKYCPGTGSGRRGCEAKVKSNLQAVIGKGTQDDSRSTGELLSALGVSTAKMTETAILILCRFCRTSLGW